MRYLLDTNVVSELVRARPDPRVVEWVRQAPDTGRHLSVLSVGEIRKGLDRLEPGSRHQRLAQWVEQDLPAWFGSRILAIDLRIAERWGRLLAGSPRSLPAIESLLAATEAHGRADPAATVAPAEELRRSF